MTSRHLALFTLLTVAACLPAAWSPADEPAKVEKPAADSMLGNDAGDVRDDNGLKMKMVWCPPRIVRMENAELVALGEQFVNGIGIKRRAEISRVQVRAIL